MNEACLTPVSELHLATLQHSDFLFSHTELYDTNAYSSLRTSAAVGKLPLLPALGSAAC